MRSNLRHIGLIARREYLHRVRTKSFIITTLLTPAIMLGFMFLPGVFMNMKTGEQKTIVVVSDDPHLADEFQRHLIKSSSDAKYEITMDQSATNAERAKLDSDVTAKDIDAYLWLTREAVAKGKVEYHARSTSDLAERDKVQDAVTFSAVQLRLADKGIRGLDMDSVLKPVEIEAVQVGRGKSNADAMFITAMLLVLILYMTVILHGVAVMRSVLEEKTSRVMEVLLSAVTPKELMAGKITGVGAVGLTQIAIWAVLSLGFSLFGMVSSGFSLSSIRLSPSMGIFFVVFYLLGFLLYSSFSAALGAMVNSDEEAQQLQFLIVMPIILAMMVIGVIMRAPSAPISVVLSMVPFFAPILMYLRIVVEQPPAWQLVLCIAIMIATIYGVLSICARIYRVGILMSGKRPTLPEIIKWIRYA